MLFYLYVSTNKQVSALTIHVYTKEGKEDKCFILRNVSKQTWMMHVGLTINKWKDNGDLADGKSYFLFKLKDTHLHASIGKISTSNP